MNVRNPQLFESADVEDIHKFVDDPAWILEQKVDGMRCMVVVNMTTDDDDDTVLFPTVSFLTRGGKSLNSSAAKLHFEKLRKIFSEFADDARSYSSFGRTFEIVFDAELMTDSGELVLLDLPFTDIPMYETHPSAPYGYRRDKLYAIAHRYFYDHGVVKLVRMAPTPILKQKLVDDVRATGGEGVMAKKINSPYIEGKRVKHSLKLKFTSTADVVVIAKNHGESKHSIRGGQKQNYVFGVYVHDPIHGGLDLVEIGNCSAIGKQDADVGDVIEVEYLYVGAGKRLTQPRMKRIRNDKSPLECTGDQLRSYSKELV